MKIILPFFNDSTIYRFNVNSSKFTWFQTGGVIDTIFRPKSVADLTYFLQNFADKSMIKILGACSNVIIRDGGFRGVAIRLGGGFNYINKLDDTTIQVGGSTLDLNIANFAMENGIGGLEFLASIPGSLGGNIKMNAGCYGSDLSSILVEYECVDMNGKIHIFKRENIDFTYRNNPKADGFIFTKATLQGFIDTKENIAKKMKEIKEKRELSQPVKSNTGGSTFVNPKGQQAWQLIESCGFRGIKLGGAQVSEQHCNFLLNIKNATSLEIESLGEVIRATVLEKHNIELQWEIERFGSF